MMKRTRRDRHGPEGEDCAGGAAGTVDDSGLGATVSGSPEPDLCMEEAADRAGGAGVRVRWKRGRGRAHPCNRGALRQDRATHCGTRFFIEEVRTMSKPDREALLDRDHADLSVRRQCQL